MNNRRYDISCSVGAREEFAASFITQLMAWAFKMSTTPEKNSIAYCKRENARNEFDYLLGISCTSR